MTAHCAQEEVLERFTTRSGSSLCLTEDEVWKFYRRLHAETLPYLWVGSGVRSSEQPMHWHLPNTETSIDLPQRPPPVHDKPTQPSVTEGLGDGP